MVHGSRAHTSRAERGNTPQYFQYSEYSEYTLVFRAFEVLEAFEVFEVLEVLPEVSSFVASQHENWYKAKTASRSGIEHKYSKYSSIRVFRVFEVFKSIQKNSSKSY